jgi:telomerase reverse transcriptase
MAGKRKRMRSKNSMESDQKRQKIAANTNSKDPIIKHALLAQYYPQVLSLREYLLSKLPTASKVRRKKILFAGRRSDSKQSDKNLARFLDETLIGVCDGHGISHQDRWRQWTAFSQKADESAFANLSGVGVYSQSEVRVDARCCLNLGMPLIVL